MSSENNTPVEDNSDTFDKILSTSNQAMGWEEFFNPNNKIPDEPENENALENEDVNAEFVEEEIKENPSPKKRLTQNERIKKQLNEERALNQELITRLQQFEAQNISLTQNNLSKEYANLEDKEKYWNVIKDDYKNALAGAYEGGAASSVADAADKMQIANIELERLKNEKDRVITQYEQVKNYQPQNYSSHSSTEYDSNLNEFLDKYPFLSPNGNNPNYAPDAVAKVSKISSDLATEYKMEGRGNEIRSKEYFQELENRMSKEFNNNQKQNSNSNRSARMVAPVGKRNAIAHDEPQIRFNSTDQTLMMNLRNEFGSQYDDLLKTKFIESKKNNNKTDDSMFF